MEETVAGEVLRLLLEQQALSASQAAELQKQLAGGKAELRDLLVEGEVVSDEVFTQVWAQALGMEYITLDPTTIPPDVLRIVPESTAREHSVVAFEQTKELLKVAMADPSDRQIVEFIHKKVDIPVRVYLASETGVKEVLKLYQQSLETEFADIVKPVIDQLDASDGKDLSKTAEDLPVIQITDAILRHAIFQGASDIHIEPSEKDVAVRYRIDGILSQALTLPKRALAGLVARIKVLSNLKIDEHRLPQDGRFKVETDDYKVAFRVSILPVFDGEKIVMRLLDESGKGLTLDEIGFQPKTLELFRRNVHKPHGMVLVTGPTGSGKTTTLYAALRELNTAEVNISTVEDPIEYRMPGINQTQINTKIGLTFSNGLRSLVRQDPDILMVGEIRDEETAALAVNAALTGHLVLTTLHTNSAAGALPRLLEMGVESFLVASTANLLQAQRLVRRLCQDCRKEVKLTAEMVQDLGDVFDLERLTELLAREKKLTAGASLEGLPIFEPGSCQACTNGYKGRTGIYEVIEMTDDLRTLVTDQVTSQILEEKARADQRMVSMFEDGFLKVVTGDTSLEEVLRVAEE